LTPGAVLIDLCERAAIQNMLPQSWKHGALSAWKNHWILVNRWPFCGENEGDRDGSAAVKPIHACPKRQAWHE
jgi:hypothetical protein